MTGLPPEEAAQFLEMAGGNLEAAVSLFFDMNAGGGAPAPAAAAPASPAAVVSPAQSLVFGSEPPPPAWAGQGLDFSKEPGEGCCLLQEKNGPCGALAALNGVIVAQAGCPEASFAVDDAALCRGIASILARCAEGRSGAVVAVWAEGQAGGELLETEVEASEDVLMATLLSHAASFRGPGGVLLLCYSAVLSRGLERVREDIRQDGGSPPLVQGPHALCTTELFNLLTAGTARGNVCAYGADGQKVSWRPRTALGLLSRDELDMGRPLADELKGPSQPVFVLHGGDHFTLLWRPKKPAGQEGNDSGAVDWLHWNGLPPSRRLVRLRLRKCPLEPAPCAPPQHVNSHWRIELGEVESIVQAKPADKQARPGCWRTHSYELALATKGVVEEDRNSTPRPEHVAAPVRFEQGESPGEGVAWRCASCYQTRFQTMCFGENAAPAAPTCKFCGKSQAEAGWTLWRNYSDLPPALQRRIDRTSGPKILSVLATRWPDVEMSLLDAAGNELPLGSTEALGAVVPST